jgi:hypothetical protein
MELFKHLHFGCVLRTECVKLVCRSTLFNFETTKRIPLKVDIPSLHLKSYRELEAREQKKLLNDRS